MNDARWGVQRLQLMKSFFSTRFRTTSYSIPASAHLRTAACTANWAAGTGIVPVLDRRLKCNGDAGGGSGRSGGSSSGGGGSSRS